MLRLPHLSKLTFLMLCLLPAVGVLADPQPDLRLVSARDHIEEAFTTNRMLYADKERIYLASAFRDIDAGLGGELFVLARDRELVGHMHLRAANVVTRQGRSLLVGDESGIVHLFDLGVTPPQLVESIDLRRATGHFGRAAIEIRALWSDHYDDLVFAASSWGSFSVRGPNLPSFFVFELSRKQQNQ